MEPYVLDAGIVPVSDGSGDVFIRCEGVEQLFARMSCLGQQFMAFGHFQLALEQESTFDLLASQGRRAAAEVAACHPRVRSSVVDRAGEGGLHLRVHSDVAPATLDSLFRGESRCDELRSALP